MDKNKIDGLLGNKQCYKWCYENRKDYITRLAEALDVPISIPSDPDDPPEKEIRLPKGIVIHNYLHSSIILCRANENPRKMHHGMIEISKSDESYNAPQLAKLIELTINEIWPWLMCIYEDTYTATQKIESLDHIDERIGNWRQQIKEAENG